MRFAFSYFCVGSAFGAKIETTGRRIARNTSIGTSLTEIQAETGQVPHQLAAGVGMTSFMLWIAGLASYFDGRNDSHAPSSQNTTTNTTSPAPSQDDTTTSTTEECVNDSIPNSEGTSCVCPAGFIVTSTEPISCTNCGSLSYAEYQDCLNPEVSFGAPGHPQCCCFAEIVD